MRKILRSIKEQVRTLNRSCAVVRVAKAIQRVREEEEKDDRADRTFQMRNVCG